MVLLYLDRLTGDEVLDEHFHHREILEGMLWEVESKWVVPVLSDSEKMMMEAQKTNSPLKIFPILKKHGDNTEPISPNHRPFTDADDPASKKIDIVLTFDYEQVPPYTVQEFLIHMKNFTICLAYKLEEEERKEFQEGIVKAAEYLLSMLDKFQFFVTRTLRRAGLVFAYQKDDASAPTFLYFAHGLKSYNFYKPPFPLEHRSVPMPLLPLHSPSPDLDHLYTYKDVLTGMQPRALFRFRPNSEELIFGDRLCFLDHLLHSLHREYRRIASRSYLYIPFVFPCS